MGLVQIQQVVAVRARVRAVELERELRVLDLRRAQVRRKERGARVHHDDGGGAHGHLRCRRPSVQPQLKAFSISL